MKSPDSPLPASQIRTTYVALSFAIALAFLYLRTFLLPATPLVSYGDEIHYFLHGVRMLHGQLPYRDFFTFVLPGTDVLYAGVFRLLGVHQWVAQGLVVVVGCLLAGVITWVSSRVLHGPLVLLPGLLFLVFDFNGALDATHHWWCTLLVLSAAGVLLGGRGVGRIVAAGGLCAVATFFTQTQGGLGLIAVAVYLASTSDEGESKRLWSGELLPLISTFVVVLGALGGYFIDRIGLGTIAYWTLYFPAVYFPTLEAHTPGAYFLSLHTPHGLAELLSMAPNLFIHAAVPLVYVLCLVRLVREKKTMKQKQWRAVLLLTLIGVALFVSVMSAATILRLCVVAPPAMILCVWLFQGRSLASRWMRAALWTAAVVLLFYLPVSRQRFGGTVLNMPTGPAAFGNASQYDAMRWLMENAHAGDSIFDNPGAAFALSLESPASVDYVTTGEFTRPEQVEQVVQALEARRTRFVTLYPQLYGPIQTGDNLGPFREYVYRNYHLVRADRAGQVWERN